MSASAALALAKKYRIGGAVEANPSLAQKEAGNYKMRHISFQGIPISIENPKGTVRSGIDSDGKPWANRMTTDYGYIKRTNGKDGDQVDCFVGPNRRSDKVWVIDQLHHQHHKFDEHKCLLGFDTEKQAMTAYHASYGRKYGAHHTVGGVTEMSVDAFKEWLKGGGGKKPVSPDVPKYQEGGAVSGPEPFEAGYPEPPPMVSDEDLARTQIAQQAAPREGGLMQTIPQFAQMVQTPEGRSKLWEATKTAASEFIPGMIEQAKGPGEAMAGKMTPEQEADWAAGMGMGLIGASTPFRFAEPAGKIGVFGGRGAVGHDAAAVAKAEEMKAQGADRDTIYKQTGWFQDPHTNEWSFHIPMDTARLNSALPAHPVYGNDGIVSIPYGKKGPLTSVLQHSELYKMYPWLKDWYVSGDNFMLENPANRGATALEDKRILLSPATPPEMLDTLIHEVNHVIADHEGLSQGGDWRNFLPQDFAYRSQIAMDKRDDLNAILKDQGFQDLKSLYTAMYKNWFLQEAGTPIERAYVKRVDRMGLTNQMLEVIQGLEQHVNMERQAKDNYLNLHGEGMSRAAEFMRKYTPEQARNIPPWNAFMRMRSPVFWDKSIKSEHASPIQWKDMSPGESPGIIDFANKRFDVSPSTKKIASEDAPRTRQDLAASLANELLERYNRDPEQISRYLQDAKERGFSPENIDLVKEYLPSNLFTSPSWEAAFKETPPPEFQYKPEELGIGAGERYYDEPRPPVEPEFDEKFNEHIAPHTDKEQFFKNFFGGMYRQGLIHSDWYGEHGFYFDGMLTGPDGNIIGNVTQSFNPETGRAYMGYLSVDRDVRGKGLVPNMLSNQVDLYRKLGIKKVDLLANIDVGSYAWAKYGFLPEAYEWAEMAHQFKQFLNTRPQLTTTNWERHYLFEILNNPDPRAMWLLSDVKATTRNGEQIGKHFLVGNSWHGTLDLTNSHALNRFMDHVGSKIKKAAGGEE